MICELLGLQKLSEEQLHLIGVLFEAHRVAGTKNPCFSTVVSRQCWEGSGSVTQGLIGGIATLGQCHGPISDARGMLHWGPSLIAEMAELGQKIPGFGNSFYKLGIDPAFGDIFQMIKDNPIGCRLMEYGEIISTIKGNLIWPNAAGITAAVAEMLDVPRPREMLLFLIPRMSVWLGNMMI